MDKPNLIAFAMIALKGHNTIANSGLIETLYFFLMSRRDKISVEITSIQT